MVDEDSVLNAHNIRGNPIYGSAEAAKSPVHDDELSFSHDHSWVVLQLWWDVPDEIEETASSPV
jgi:hypothetical protein